MMDGKGKRKRKRSCENGTAAEYTADEELLGIVYCGIYVCMCNNLVLTPLKTIKMVQSNGNPADEQTTVQIWGFDFFVR